MTQVRDGFSLAHRAALTVAEAQRTLMTMASTLVVASLALIGVSYAGGPDGLAVTNANTPLLSSISVFAAGGGKNKSPITTISGGPLIPGVTAVNATSVLGGIAVSPVGALYVTNSLSVVSPKIPDFVLGFAPNATGASGPVVAIPASKVAPLSLPQGVAFVNATGPSLGQFYVTNLTGGVKPANAGSLILFPADAGTSTNPMGTPVAMLNNTLICKALGLPDTGLLLPAGVATDAKGNAYVANAGSVKPAAPSYVTEYLLSDVSSTKTGCVAFHNLVGLGALKSANGVAVDPITGNIWVSDLAANALLEFSPAGAVITRIVGKHTQLKSPMGIALSPVGLKAGVDNVYVANNRAGSILLFENVSSRGTLNLRPLQVIKGQRTRINLPVGVAPM